MKQDHLKTLIAQLDAAPHGNAGKLVDEAAQWLQMSRQSVYRAIRALGWSSGRKLRTDKHNASVPATEVTALANLLRQSRRQSDKQLLTTGAAIEIAHSNGLLSKAISTSTALRLMRQHGVHPDQMDRATPHVNLRSLHPNHVWQIDSSVCVLYRLRNNGLAVIDAEEFRAKKPSSFVKIERERVLRYVATDHYSGAFKVKYFLTPGESLKVFFEFMLWAFDAQPGVIMRGVPSIIMLDQASGQMSKQLNPFFTALAIRVLPHEVGNARATGQVEQCQNLIERHLEGRFAMERISDIVQLEARTLQWQISHNSTKRHSRHGHTRYHAWQMIRPEQLRIRPDEVTCRALLHSVPVSRLVNGDLYISYAPKGFGQQWYSVGHVPNVRNGDSVQVILNPYATPAIFVLSARADGVVQHIQCDPAEYNPAGFAPSDPVIGEAYGKHAESNVDQQRKALDTAAWGATEKRDIAKLRKNGAIAFDGTVQPFKPIEESLVNLPATMKRPGTQIAVENPALVQRTPLSVIEALMRLSDNLDRSLTQAEAEYMQKTYPAGVPHAALQGIYEAMRSGSIDEQQIPRERPRLRFVGGN